ncbi:MAG: methyltetrahydrofolate cobalamin methyltransferase [Armatimonadia bacterium]|nr:methyltetrahydrofolate cobalamin methyltransferase [Armatimonadia bacterium]
MIIIGELINGTREPVQKAILAKDEDFIRELAVRQAEAGADFIDCNVGMVGASEAEQMEWLVSVVADAVDVPPCVDTASPDAMRAGLEAWAGDERPICNSVTLERERIDSFLPIVSGRDVQIVALVMTDEGVPKTVQGRVDAAQRLFEALTASGSAPEDIFIDPVVTPLSVEPEGARIACDAIREIREALPDCHTVCGLSNVSYGLPRRTLLNRVFLSQAVLAGLDSAILDPLDQGIMSSLYAAEALAGRDEWCANYLGAYRRGVL